MSESIYTFCENCRDEVKYVMKEEKMVGTIKGVQYEYVGRQAYCADCGAPVFLPELNDANLEALYEVYRETNGIISFDKVREIPKKYAIGKRPLSLLLGWGELTFSRYCDGDVPSKQYSDILERIYEDPHAYLELLEKNQTNLKSVSAYEKSRQAVEKLLACPKSEGSKINLVIDYLLAECEDITPLSLQKALYYVQGFFYAFFQRFLFEEDCEAWAHGPVYREIYFRFRDYRFDPIKRYKDVDHSAFTAAELCILDNVIKSLCCYSGKVLEQFTHEEAPWLVTRGDIPPGEPSEKIIEKELIGSYFAMVKEKYGMVNPSDIKIYAQRMFDAI